MDQRVESAKSISDEILEIILEESGIERSKLTPDATFESLGLASVNLVMALLTIEEKFDVYVPLGGELADAKNLESFVGSLAKQIVEEREKSGS